MSTAQPITDLKPYPKMKDSGVPWLGEVPVHWELPRLGSILRERGEVNVNGAVTEVLSVLRDRGVIPYSEKGNIGNKKSEDITRYKIVRPNDIVVNCMNVIIGSVGLSRYTGCLSPVYYVLTRRSEQDVPQYLNAYFQTKPFQQSLVRIGNGIMAHRMRIPMELLKCEPFPRPPTDEQAAIVRFLDHANRRIRRYIRAKQRLIKLLEEQKQAIIHRAVTRGLDPNVRLKPSGIEWLGDVPEHWAVPLLGRFLKRIEQGWSPVAAEGEFGDKQWAVITLSAVKNGIFNAKAIKPISESAKVPAEIEVMVGDFLLSRSNTRQLVGDVCVVDEVRPRTILCDLVYRLRINEQVLLPRFLMYQLLSSTGRWQIERDARGSSQTMVKLSQGHIRRWRILLPPYDEQVNIVEQLDSVARKTMEGVSRIEREIELLHEYHMRLVTNIVTGKLDVREAAANLPDEEIEPWNEEERDGASEDGLAWDDIPAEDEELHA